MRPNYTLARLYVPQSLIADAVLDLPKAQAHYLASVLRKSAGDDVRLFNGDSGEWRAQIAALDKRSVHVTIKEQLRAPANVPDVWLLFSLVRKHRNSFIIEKATELGVAQLRPVITARTQFAKLREDRMLAQAIEAAEQTERLCVPQCHAPQKLDKLLSGWDTSRRIIFADEAGGAQGAATVMANISGPCALLVGPEGGFDPREREQLRGLDFVTPVTLGPRILRADTAAASMLTLFQAGAAGDWSKGHV